MRTIKPFIFILFCLEILSCSQKTLPYSAEVNFLNKDAQGTITVKSIGYGKNKNKAILDAQKNAFKTLLFKGLPGTELNVPLIENENDTRSTNASYLKKFFDEGNFISFIMSSTESSNLIVMKGTKKISVDIKINYNSLRKDLEQNKIIRKFGF
jgi:hypothetical protein